MGDSTASIEQRVRELVARGDRREAARIVVAALGPELLGFLHHALGPHAADDAYGETCLDLVEGIAAFEGRSSLRTWCYVVARHAAERVGRKEARVRRGRTGEDALADVAAGQRTATRPHLKTENKDLVTRLREGLAPEDRMLLSLRIDRGMRWGEIAEALDDAALDERARARAAARLRKRYERLVETLRERLAAESGSVVGPVGNG